MTILEFSPTERPLRVWTIKETLAEVSSKLPEGGTAEQIDRAFNDLADKLSRGELKAYLHNPETNCDYEAPVELWQLGDDNNADQLAGRLCQPHGNTKVPEVLLRRAFILDRTHAARWATSIAKKLEPPRTPLTRPEIKAFLLTLSPQDRIHKNSELLATVRRAFPDYEVSRNSVIDTRREVFGQREAGRPKSPAARPGA